MKNAIIKQIKNGLNTDVIVGMFLNKECSNKDEILNIIKKFKWEQFIGRKTH
tara:strand:+ start:399 stop:554 length:156 start_codon:yes stop_codon:yes gene_type:complete